MCEGCASFDIAFARLAGSYVRFQPRLADFQRDTGDAVGDALTAALLTHAALSEGDWVEVPLGDATYDLRVLELRPSPAVSVIGAPVPCSRSGWAQPPQGSVRAGPVTCQSQTGCSRWDPAACSRVAFTCIWKGGLKGRSEA